MKKIILTLLIFISCIGIAKPPKKGTRLHSDGKLHIEKLLGKWYGTHYEIAKDRNNNYYFITYDSEKYVIRLYVNKNRLESRDKVHIFAYDTKFKTMVKLSTNGEIYDVITRQAPKGVN